jgi:hypothetical protein
MTPNACIQALQRELVASDTVACRFAGPAPRFGLAALAGSLLNGVQKAAVAQGLGLVEFQADVGRGFFGQHLLKARAVGS